MYGSAHRCPLITTPLTENHESKPEKVNKLLWCLVNSTGWWCSGVSWFLFKKKQTHISFGVAVSLVHETQKRNDGLNELNLP